MTKNRLEAFSDGVIAIIITVMVLELRAPHAPTLDALLELYPIFLSYVLSFIFIGIYWNNHHHLFHIVHHVTGGVLWANLHLLFWLSLIPFVTGWTGENHFAQIPMAVYGIVLFGAGVAYVILQMTIIADQGPQGKLAEAVGADYKGKASAILYLLAIPLSFLHAYIGGGIYIFVAMMWLVPDRRIESKLHD